MMVPGDARAPSTEARDPAGGARREGLGLERSGNPTDWSPPPARRLSTRRSLARGPPPARLSRAGWLQRPRARRVGFAPARARACALAGWRARARAGSGAGRTARAPARSVWIRWHSGPQPRLRSPARRPAEAGKGAVGAGRRPALGELGEERGGDGGRSRRGGEGGGGAPFLFSDLGASGTQSPELGGTRRLRGPRNLPGKRDMNVCDDIS
ncbi:translation initiation factor IF-2-like [Lynx canadensis]|uniref:translation initiation factor IF-2-like n=1 Tax=Lynx canadensis TaxID=61383 RepID=UPI0011B09114|nr:translation initiation factor IF-2-like [Lynx canadensis]